MKETALFVGWGGAYPGRESVALDGYHEWVKILEELKEQGEIEDFLTVALGPTGGDLDGFTLVFADEMTLMQLSQREDFHRLQVQGEREFAKFMVVPAITGERVEKEFKLLQDEILPVFEHAHV
ncbi:MAG TPA: hypothetical protein VIU86_17515 [Gaiellaceae bacterium]